MGLKIANYQEVASLQNALKPSILVTGGAGFIGSNFVRKLLAQGKYKVINLDLLSYAGNIESIADILDVPNHVFIKGDIADRNLISEILNHFNPSAVVNFAAESHVDRSIEDAKPFIQTNIVGVYELLEAVRAYLKDFSADKVKKFRYVQVSTDEVFGELGETGSFSEESKYQPNSPYSASKAAADHLVQAYNRTYHLPTLITHCSNNYGPYQFPEKLIPVVVMNAINGKKIPIYGDGKNIRDWLFVTDHCDGIMTVIEKATVGKKYCIGGNTEKTNIEIVMTVCKILNELLPDSPYAPHENLIEYVDDRAGHDRRYAVNTNKIYSELNWKPKEKFETGLKKTIKWYLDNKDWCETVLKISSQQDDTAKKLA